MSELRTEVKTIRHNEAIAERGEIISLQKELDSLNQKTREDLESLRNDVTIEMNNRKIATRAEQQTMEIKIQDLNNNFTKRLADMRTEAEAQKWQTTRLLIGMTLLNRLMFSDACNYDNMRIWHYSISAENGGCAFTRGCPDRLPWRSGWQTRTTRQQCRISYAWIEPNQILTNTT